MPDSLQDSTRTNRFREFLDTEFHEVKTRILKEFKSVVGSPPLRPSLRKNGLLYQPPSRAPSGAESPSTSAHQLLKEPFGNVMHSSFSMGSQRSWQRDARRVSVDTASSTSGKPKLKSAGSDQSLQSGGLFRSNEDDTSIVAFGNTLTFTAPIAITPPQASTPRVSPRPLITPRSDGPRIRAGHQETVVFVDEFGYDPEEAEEKEIPGTLQMSQKQMASLKRVSVSENALELSFSSQKSTSSKMSPLDRWRMLVLALMCPAIHRPKTKYHMYDCWAPYAAMLRHNEANCQKELSAAMAKVLRGRQQSTFNDGPRESGASLFSVLSRPQKFFYSLVLHPESRIRVTWILFSFLVLLYDAVTLPLNAFFDFEDSNTVELLMWFTAIFWLLDIFVSFISGRYVHGVLELRLEQLASRYLRTWFPFDTSLVVLDLIVLVVDNVTEGRSVIFYGTAIRGVRVVRLVRLLRLGKFQLLLSELLAINSKGSIVIAGMLKTTLIYAIYCHFLACMWYGIGRVQDDGWGSSCRDDTADLSHCYFRAAQWALTQSLGANVISYTSTLEWAVSTCSLLAGLVFFAIFLGKTAEAVSHFTNAEKLEMMQRCALYTKNRNMSSDLSHRLIRYVSSCDLYVDLGQQLKREKEILALLPASMQAELLEEARRPLLSKFQIVRDLEFVSQKMSRQLCATAVASQMCLSGEVVFSTGDTAIYCRIVDVGSLVYLNGLDLWWDFASSVTCLSLGVANDAWDEEDYLEIQNMKTRSIRSEILETARAQNRPTASPGRPCAKSSATHGTLESWDTLLNESSKQISEGDFVSEMVLWTPWTHTGDLMTTCDSVLLQLSLEAFSSVMKLRIDTCLMAARYAHQYVKQMSNTHGGITDIHEFFAEEDDLDESGVTLQHMIFLSHYKAEAGTEATLMMEALQMLIERESGDIDDSAVFLDSEDLTDLTLLKDHVKGSRNLLFLLTPGVLLRPWCLVEIVTAMDHGVRIVPIEIQRPGMKFHYPDERFYAKLRRGELIKQQDFRLLANEGITLEIIENALQYAFLLIALPFSPHKSKGIREAELLDIMQRCQMLRLKKSKAPGSIPEHESFGVHVRGTFFSDDSPNEPHSPNLRQGLSRNF